MPLKTFIDSSSGTPTYNPINVTYKKDGNWFGAEGLPWSTHDDFSGAESAFFNFWQQQQQNAYELELWNLANKYNSPEQQMARYQAAGLNPNLAYGQMPQTSPASASSPIPAKPTNFKAENKLKALSLASQTINQLAGLMKGITDVVDYAKYGASEHGLRNTLLGQQSDALAASNAFKQYIQYPMMESKYRNGPVTVTLPDGSQHTWNYNDTVEAMAKVAGANKDYQDAAIKQFFMNNIYPEQAAIQAGNAQNAKNRLAVYNKVVDSLKLSDNPLAQMVLWRLIDRVDSFDPMATQQQVAKEMMFILPFL